MSDELERIWDEVDRRYPHSQGFNSPRRVAFKAGAEWAIAAMTPTPQVVETVEDLPEGRYFDGTYEWDWDGEDWAPLRAPQGMPPRPDLVGLQRVVSHREPLTHPHPTPDECLCYGADGVTDQKCPACVRADVLAEVRATALRDFVNEVNSELAASEEAGHDLGRDYMHGMRSALMQATERADAILDREAGR